jgi:multidrug efflux pump subunit AcrA (membrane-fusion protein)
MSRKMFLSFLRKQHSKYKTEIYVYKVNSEGKAESAQVTVFPLNNGKEYIVEDGLQQGETIVAEGAGLIQENTQVATSPVGRQ